MQRTAARVYGVITAALALLGLTMGSTYIFGVMNADLALDWSRTFLAILLLYAGFASDDDRILRGSLWAVGIISAFAGFVSLMDSKLLGMAPNGFTIFDAAFHLVGGLFAIAIAVKKETKHGTPVDA